MTHAPLILFASIARWADEAAFAADLARLPAAEAARLARRRPDDRRRSALGRILLEEGLARLGYHPRRLHDLAYTRFGKPFLKDGPAFNISHSGLYVVVALDVTRHVGIDIEHLASRVAPHELAGTMSATQWQDIARAADPHRRFLEYWTMKESVVKGHGDGLGLPLEEIMGDEGGLVLHGEAWGLSRVEIAPDYVCHVAARGPLPTPLIIAA